VGRRKLGSVLLLVLLYAGAAAADPSGPTGPQWDGPPAKWVSDIEHRIHFDYFLNTSSDVSNDGKWVGFYTVNDSRGDLWLTNTETGKFRRITQSHNGKPLQVEGNKYSYGAFSGYGPAISANGRYLAFSSQYSNLVQYDNNKAADIFVYDRVKKETVLISRNSEGTKANQGSFAPSISADGRFIAFDSRATNLSPGDTGGGVDVYLKDRETKATTLVSVGPDGKGNRRSGHGDVSDDGTRVSFLSDATNLVESDTNRATDAFVRDLTTDETLRVSVDSEGNQLKPFVYAESASVYRDGAEELRISGNGQVVVYSSHANKLVPEDENDNVDIFVHEIDTGVTERVSEPTGGGDAYRPEDKECGNNGECFGFIQSWAPSISADGRLVYFISAAPLISDEDDDGASSEDDVFVHDRNTDETILISRRPNGEPAKSSNVYPGTIAPGGGWLTFTADSRMIDGHGGDQNVRSDVYLQELPKVP
jgi:Tol biopolymer transport system component